MAYTKEQLYNEIASAFSNRVYPGDDKIAAQADDDLSFEGSQVGSFFRGKDWRDVTWQSILSHPDLDPYGFLFFLTEQGFAYYLPAFLQEMLDVEKTAELADAVCFALTPSEDSESSMVEEKNEQRRKQFNREESRTIAHVLDYLVEEWRRLGFAGDQPQKALTSYWAVFKDDD